jgi:hypothetical protein
MSFSYSALNNYGKSSLPSVESWGTNMNILRDPPKSITTRRINKVGETSSITQMIDDSSNRNCEAIKQFARGVNPFVSVSYSNYGNNGGQRGGGISTTNGGKQAYLPYRVVKDGAFRPPVLRQEQLLPLSRLPRAWTSAFTQPGFTDYSKSKQSCKTGKETREVRDTVLKACVRPSAVFNISHQSKENYDVKYVIQNPHRISGTSGVRTMDITQQTVKEPTKGIDKNMVHTFAKSNVGYNKHIDNNEFDPERYLQEVNSSNVGSNVSSNIQSTPIENILDLSNIKTQDLFNITRTAPLSGNEQVNYIHNDIELDRSLPGYQVTTNIGKNIYKNIKPENSINLKRTIPNAQATSNIGSHRKGGGDIISRNYKLADKINPGGFVGRGNRPVVNRVENTRHLKESNKTRMVKKIGHYNQRFNPIST